MSQFGKKKRVVPVDFSKMSSSDRLMAVMEEFYKRYPYFLYMPSAELYIRCKKFLSRDAYDEIVSGLVEQGKIVRRGEDVGLAGRKIPWKTGERQLADKIEQIYEEAGLSTPIEELVLSNLRVHPEWFANVINALIELGRLVRVGDDVIYTTGQWERAKNEVIDLIKKNNGANVSEVRDALGISRKYAVAILEHLDDLGITTWEDDIRVLCEDDSLDQ